MNAICNLVLSGGGTRGYSHIGVVSALFEKGIKLNAISGASCGALIGAFLADGFHPSEIAEILITNEPEISFNYRHFWENLFSFDAYTQVLKNNLRSKTFDTLQLPLYVSTTNLDTGRQVIFHEGNLLEALIASAAVPVLLPSRIINDTPYADGGLSNNLPVEPFLESEHKVIGVHANPISNFDPHANFIHRLDRALHLLMYNGIAKWIGACDVFIEPAALKSHGLFESKKTQELIDLGYNCVMNDVDLSPLVNGR